MGTHDEETRKFFVNSGVTCVLFPREGRDQQSSILHRNTTDRIFTHHQKTARPGGLRCPTRSRDFHCANAASQSLTVAWRVLGLRRRSASV